jgi:hypothetical protein
VRQVEDDHDVDAPDRGAVVLGEEEGVVFPPEDPYQRPAGTLRVRGLRVGMYLREQL